MLSLHSYCIPCRRIHICAKCSCRSNCRASLPLADTGRLMARYCVAFDTMKNFHELSGTEVLNELVWTEKAMENVILVFVSFGMCTWSDHQVTRALCYTVVTFSWQCCAKVRSSQISSSGLMRKESWTHWTRTNTDQLSGTKICPCHCFLQVQWVTIFQKSHKQNSRYLMVFSVPYCTLAWKGGVW